jgi:hypothetical protein
MKMAEFISQKNACFFMKQWMRKSKSNQAWNFIHGVSVFQYDPIPAPVQPL